MADYVLLSYGISQYLGGNTYDIQWDYGVYDCEHIAVDELFSHTCDIDDPPINPVILNGNSSVTFKRDLSTISTASFNGNLEFSMGGMWGTPVEDETIVGYDLRDAYSLQNFMNEDAIVTRDIAQKLELMVYSHVNAPVGYSGDREAETFFKLGPNVDDPRIFWNFSPGDIALVPTLYAMYHLNQGDPYYTYHFGMKLRFGADEKVFKAKTLSARKSQLKIKNLTLADYYQYEGIGYRSLAYRTPDGNPRMVAHTAINEPVASPIHIRRANDTKALALWQDENW